MIYNITDADRIRFWHNVDIGDDRECWEWCASRHYLGYGWFRLGTIRLAHRASWILAHGIIPEGYDICHICDNPSCVNPKHLFLGTAADNAADMMRKGRARALFLNGEKHPNSKLTSNMVGLIRKEVCAGRTSIRQIARNYGVDHMTILNIARGKTWRGDSNDLFDDD